MDRAGRPLGGFADAVIVGPMDWDDRFRPERYTDPAFLSEGLFADYKSEIYPIRDDWKKCLDFVVDFIALANMSYRFGKVARLLFGMDRNMHDIVGVEGQSTRAAHLSGINYAEHGDLHRLFNELILRDFRWAVEKYVEPRTVHLEMKWGMVEGRLCAYLEIGAETANAHAYRVGREIRASHNGKVIRPGDSWRRCGESNCKLSSEEYDLWLSTNDCPVLYGRQWQRYFDRLQGGDFAQAADLPGYQEPRVDTGELLADRVKRFLESDQSLLVIEGRAGMGKTKFIQRLVCELARNAVSYVRDLPDDEPPGAWIPVYKELRQTPFRRDDALDKCIINWWNSNGDFLAGRSYPKATSILKRPNSRWLVCLDGLDEMSKKAIEGFYEALSTFRIEYPRVKVLITTRSDAVDPGWKRKGVVVRMSELDTESIRSYLSIAIQGNGQQMVDAEERRAQALGMLGTNDELAQLVRTPLYLDAYARVFAPEPLPLAELPLPETVSPIVPVPPVQGEIAPEEFMERIPELRAEMSEGDSASYSEAEHSVEEASSNDGEASDDHTSPPPPLTQVLDRMLERIWEHDRKHFQEPKDSTSASAPLLYLKHLAAKVDGRGRFDVEECRKVKVPKQANWLARMLSLGLIEGRGDWLFFSSRLLQSFLAADYLWHLWQAKNQRSLRRLMVANAFWHRACNLFRELAVHDPEAVNFVSQLVGGLGEGNAVAQPGTKLT